MIEVSLPENDIPALLFDLGKKDMDYEYRCENRDWKMCFYR